jgi:RNA polymerase sigma-70 factor, ECF subfamily
MNRFPARGVVQVGGSMSDYRLADDGDLVTAIAGGRDAAVSVLYDRYHRQCYGFALRILGAESDAEEAVQETFVRVWRSAGQYDEAKAGVGGWVLSITRNLCIDELRRRRRRVPEAMQSDEAPEHPAADHTEDEALRGVMGEQVRASLQSLTSEQRSAIELVYFHGLSSSEVGRILGVPAPTVRSRLRLGLLKLAGILQKQGLISVD